MAVEKQHKTEKGISIIEILTAVAIMVVALTSLLGIAGFTLKIFSSAKETIQANAIAQETLEAVRNFRDETNWQTDGLGTLVAGVNYYPQKSDPPLKWTLIQGTETIDGFTRKVVFANVSRDTNDNIVEPGGTNDPNTKKAIVTISWQDKQAEIVTYFTNWKQ